jgi:glycine cleavage system regulatory protein
MTGAPLFAMELVVSVPATTRVSELRERLAEVCDDLNIDWQLTAL